MATHHPQGWARAPGGQLRYWIRSVTHGCLGGIGFSSAGWHQQARDAFIGWSPDARAANLPRVVCNHRFLILPGVRVHGLASRVLRMATDRLAEDWQAAYAVRPLMAFTYISPGHSGRCYRAARWRCCPQRTEGRRPDCAGGAPGVRRSVWMKPLSAGWREALCRAPKRTIGTAPSLYLDADTDWACREYGRSTHTDGRVRERMVRMGRAWLRHLGESLPAIFPTRAEQKAAYRLLSNGKVSMEHILEPHQEMLVERCRLEPTVLAIQDTTCACSHGVALPNARATFAKASPCPRKRPNSSSPSHVASARTSSGERTRAFEDSPRPAGTVSRSSLHRRVASAPRPLMKPIDWLRYNQPGFAELSGDERDAIGEFVFLWSLFEARALDCCASARAIVEATKRWSERGVLSQQTFEGEQAYFRNRYCPGRQFSPHYDDLNFRPHDKEELVRKFLMQECHHAWEDAAGLLIVVYRLRNNLFHSVVFHFISARFSQNIPYAFLAMLRDCRMVVSRARCRVNAQGFATVPGTRTIGIVRTAFYWRTAYWKDALPGEGSLITLSRINPTVRARNNLGKFALFLTR